MRGHMGIRRARALSPRHLATPARARCRISASRERTEPRQWCPARTTVRRDAAASATADAVLVFAQRRDQQLVAAEERSVCRNAMRQRGYGESG
eukprot:scaffold48025_cov30-Phaeocystis_antarctica.AAC.1